jgi:hypothetical protein
LVESIKLDFIPHPKPTTPTPQATPLKVQKLTQAKMVECQLKGLCYNCDDKYFPGHKCKEYKIFMGISEDVYDEDVEVSSEYELPQTDNLPPPSDPPEVEPLISPNALICFSAPKTFKLIGYIKHKKVSS